MFEMTLGLWLIFGGIMLASVGMGLHYSRRSSQGKVGIPCWLHICLYSSTLLYYMGALQRYLEVSDRFTLVGYTFTTIFVATFSTGIISLVFCGLFRLINGAVAKYHRFVND
jgi:hypothetical protein